MNDNRKMLVLLGAMTLFAVVGFTYFALKIGAIDLANQQRFRLLFDSAIGIPDNADVRVYGIKVGTVQAMTLAEDHGAYVWVGIDPSFAVYRDARAIVKSKSLLGERFIELQPGDGPQRLESGATITDTITPLRLEDLGEIFGPLVTNVDAEQVQLAFSTLMDVIVENREAIREGGKAFATALTRMSDLIDDEQDILRLKAFLNSLTDLVVRFDRITGQNEAALVSAVRDASETMKNAKELTAQLNQLAADFPEYADDIKVLIKSTARFVKDMEEFDSKKAGLILKKILQQEGLTFSVRGYSMDELKAQMDEYEKIMQDGADAIEPECEPAMIQTGKCKSTR